MLLFLTVPLDDQNRRLLEETYCQYRDKMYAVAFSVTLNKADAEDVVQQLFLRLAQKYMPTVQRLSADGTLIYYLLTATRNTALNYVKKASQRREIPIDTTLDNVLLTDTAFKNELSAADAHVLSEIIRDLNTIYREVLYQRFVLDLSVSEIAEVNHLPITTVKKRLLRAKQLLTKKYEEHRNE